jgi:hypothetical protein
MDDYDKELDGMLFGVVVGAVAFIATVFGLGFMAGRAW